jgi:hypothetical protein
MDIMGLKSGRMLLKFQKCQLTLVTNTTIKVVHIISYTLVTSPLFQFFSQIASYFGITSSLCILPQTQLIQIWITFVQHLKSTKNEPTLLCTAHQDDIP